MSFNCSQLSNFDPYSCLLPNFDEEQDVKEIDSERQVKKARVFDPKVDVSKAEIMKVGQVYWQLNFLGEGNYHRVFEITSPSKIQVGNQEIPCESVVLKLPKLVVGAHKKDIEKSRTAMLSGLKALDQLKKEPALEENGIRLPMIYLKPKEILDPACPDQDGLWIMEKMAKTIDCHGWANTKTMEQLDEADCKLLASIKGVLHTMAKKKHEVITDFFPRNLMRSIKNEIVFVDFHVPVDDDEWAFTLFQYMFAWSAGNRNVWNYLSDGLPAKAAREMETRLRATSGYAKCAADTIPASRETHLGCCPAK